MGNTIHIVDVTNRDGVQTAKLGLAKLEKTMINLYLNELGVLQSEAGFPTTRHETNYLNANVELAEMGVLSPIVLGGWLRAIPQDVELACSMTRVRDFNLSASTSEQMVSGKFQGRKSREDVLNDMAAAVERARELGARVRGVNAEDASRTDMPFLIRFALAAKERGAERLRYCDTLGYDDPFTIYERVKELAGETGMPIEIHCHNDLGMAVACSVAGARGAIDAGVDAYINTCVNGMGERAGNADLLSVILAIKKSAGFADRYALDPRIDLSKSWRLCKYASYAFGVPIPINQPGVGATRARRARDSRDRQADMRRRVQRHQRLPQRIRAHGDRVPKRRGGARGAGTGALRERRQAEAPRGGRAALHRKIPGPGAQAPHAHTVAARPAREGKSGGSRCQVNRPRPRTDACTPRAPRLSAP